jgi:hypothetical protein
MPNRGIGEGTKMLQDDINFVESFVESLKKKGGGPLSHIKYELLSTWVSITTNNDGKPNMPEIFCIHGIDKNISLIKKWMTGACDNY